MDKNINIVPLTRFQAYNYEDNIELITSNIIKDYFHFRCKANKDIQKTIDLMKKIIEIIY